MSTRIGNYKVVKQIGEGGFAKTFLANHVLLGTPACLKKNINMSPEDEALLEQEAKVIWGLSHHSLPVLRDFIRHEKSYVLVMSFVEGKELYKVREEDYPDGIPPEHVCYITQRLLNALHYLHYHGVIHGDIKPQNVIFQAEAHNAVLVDYGLSTILPGRYTRTPGYTPAFAAPEQLTGKPPIPETDIYCLGASLIHLLGGNIAAKILPPTLPQPLVDFIMKMVRHNPLKRPKRAEPLIKELSQIREEIFGRRSSSEEVLKIS